ncbi:rim15, signal transduction response regulator [Saitoella coloradoensis]
MATEYLSPHGYNSSPLRTGIPISTTPSPPPSSSSHSLDLLNLELPPPSAAETLDLREAAEQAQSQNVVIELTLSGMLRWVSPTWQDVLGSDPSTVVGRPIRELLVGDRDAFTEGIGKLLEDGGHSHRIRFQMDVGGSHAGRVGGGGGSGDEDDERVFAQDEDYDCTTSHIIDLEAQGILLHAPASSNSPLASGVTDTMWVIRPLPNPRSLTLNLDPTLVSTLGVGAEVLASYLTDIASDPDTHPSEIGDRAPGSVMCRICEREIQSWYFERHSELCLVVHKAESEVQGAQDLGRDMRGVVVGVMDRLEGGDREVEYRGLKVMPPPPPSITWGSGTGSAPGTPPRSPRQSRPSALASSPVHSGGGPRRPVQCLRTLEVMLDLLDTALDISTPTIREDSETAAQVNEQGEWELRVQSPASEKRISQVLGFHRPSGPWEMSFQPSSSDGGMGSGVGGGDGLRLLCEDVEICARAKVDAVMRLRNAIQYGERIRQELYLQVQDVIDTAIERAIAGSEGELEDVEDEDEMMEAEEGMGVPPVLNEAVFEQPWTQSRSQSSGSGVGDERRGSQAASPGTRPGTGTETGTGGVSSGMFTPKFVRHESEERVSPGQSPSYKNVGAGKSYMDIPIAELDSNSPGGSGRSSRQGQQSHSPHAESPASDSEVSQPRAVHPRFSGLYGSPRRQPSPSRFMSSPLKQQQVYKLSIPADPSTAMTEGLSFGSSTGFAGHRRQVSIGSEGSGSIGFGSYGRFMPPPSPRVASLTPPTRATPPSIKDFDIIKPISKGAFGSVYLAKKKTTGEYFAIKILKKSDMIAKNQVTNVRAERAILMAQGENPFVAKLWFTFQTKEYLYLVMEYCNGGDCAALIKILGGLSEDWAKKYMAEIVLGVKYLHEHGIVHRDLKPDNFLIDQRGHLKLTDFGLSRMGLIGRQHRAQAHVQNTDMNSPELVMAQPSFIRERATSYGSQGSGNRDDNSPSSAGSTPSMLPDAGNGMNAPSYFMLNRHGSGTGSRRTSGVGESGDSSIARSFSGLALNSPAGRSRRGSIDSVGSVSSSFSTSALHTISSEPTLSTAMTVSSSATAAAMMPPPQLSLFDPNDSTRRFVGTPDYLAPETIKGTGQDEMSDWWSLGCILFEFLFGVPPFHDETPEKVFENILERRIFWLEEEEGDEPLISEQARDLINKLLCVDQTQRLGANGADEVTNHPFFQGISWEHLLDEEASFVPTPDNPEDTEYFDSRGATEFQDIDEQAVLSEESPSQSDKEKERALAMAKLGGAHKPKLLPLAIPPHVRERKPRDRRSSEPAQDNFGSFVFKNLPVLDRANKDVIQRLRSEHLQLVPVDKAGHAVRHGSVPNLDRPRSPSIMSLQSTSSMPIAFSSGPSSPVSSAPTTSSGHGSGVVPPAILVPSSPSSSIHSRPSVSFCNEPETVRQHKKHNSESFSSASSSPTQRAFPTPPRRRSTISGMSPRSRAFSMGSAPAPGAERPFFPESFKKSKRRSQVFDPSPSSSDTEDARGSALLRVQRRRHHSRRLSNVLPPGVPQYRPLDVLIAEDNPVSRAVLEKQLETLCNRCVGAPDGATLLRLAMSKIKFDIIFSDINLPQINGNDAARMIRTTRNTNANTPLVAVTSYINDITDSSLFDAQLEKPPTKQHIIKTLEQLCAWRTPPIAVMEAENSSKYAAPASSRTPWLSKVIEGSENVQNLVDKAAGAPSRAVGINGKAKEADMGPGVIKE